MAFDPTQIQDTGLEELEASGSMPLLKILQDQSPQINPRKDSYIAGSKAGDIVFNKTKEVLPRPVRFIPVACRSIYVEWTPKSDGGGLVAHHGLDIVGSPNYRKGDANNKYKEFLGSNELKYTTYWCILVQIGEEWENAILALTSTQLKVSRSLSTEIAKFRYEAHPTMTPPIYARSFKLDTVVEKNGAGQEYFNYKVIEPQVLEFEADEALLTQAMNIRSEALAELPSPQQLAIEASDNEVPF